MGVRDAASELEFPRPEMLEAARETGTLGGGGGQVVPNSLSLPASTLLLCDTGDWARWTYYGLTSKWQFLCSRSEQ